MPTIVLTGASMGIGRALAVEWAKRKATLVLSARGKEALLEVAREVESSGGHAIPVAGDVTNEAHREELVACAAGTGSLDVLVNNAGRGFYSPWSKIDIGELRALFELNVFAPLRLAQLAAPHLERAKGTVVMMSSIAGVVAAPRLGAYAASKFALEAFSMAMRSELASSGVRVVVIRPGPVDTPFRANASRAEGSLGYDAPDPKAQSAEDVARMTIRAAERGTSVVETSNYVRLVSAVTRFAPPALRLGLRQMASRPSI
jgi:short-subunit dehydrogenase